MEVTAREYGCQSMTAGLRRVLVRAPQAADAALWRAYGWRGEPDPGEAAAEHEAFRALLAESGAEVVLAETPHGPDPDAIYVYDPAIVADSGAILLRPGKEGRRGEPAAMGADFVEAGVPIAGQLDAPALAEGGDTVWLDDRTLLVGRGYRTNDAGIAALGELLPGVDVVAFDLPYYHGAGEVLHLMSFLSPLDVDLAAVYLPLMPVRLVEILQERGIQFVEVPDEEFETMGPNVLALGPRVALALEGNDETRRRMEAAGVDVRVYKGDQISRLGDGGLTPSTARPSATPQAPRASHVRGRVLSAEELTRGGRPGGGSGRRARGRTRAPVREALPSTSVTTAGRPATSASPTTFARNSVPMMLSWRSSVPRGSSPARSRSARRAEVPLPHGERSTSPSANTVTLRWRMGGPKSIRSQKMTP